MKCYYLLLCLFLIPFFSGAQPVFSDYFQDGTLRIDYELGGTDSTTEVFLEQMKKLPYYGGSTINFIDKFNYGNYRYQLFDAESGKLIYWRGFSPLFQEWQSTNEAKKLKRTFYQVAMLPFPKHKVIFHIDARQWSGKFKTVFSLTVDPQNYFIRDEKVPNYKVTNIVKNGDPHHKVDIAFLAEGYKADQMDKFVADAHRMAGYLFAAAPFNKHKKDFNIYAVQVASRDTGTDVPGNRVYQNTAFNSSYYTFDEPRYLTTKDLKAVYDAASCVPFDEIIVLVNSKRYGGGGFYNFVTLCTVDNKLTPKIIVHEFGHGFAGLADEYYSSSVAYNNYYNLKVEPWEPNITTMVDFKSKWQDMLSKDVPIPTPRTEKYKKVIGVFEGGGYSAKGIFSPMQDCRMKSNKAEGYCPVCQRAVEKAIELYSK